MAAETARSRYDVLRREREPFLFRARRNALLTIPSVMPLAGNSGHSHSYEPYQSVGAEGLSHLSSRLLMALLPPGRNFFRLDIPADAIAAAGTDEKIKKQITDWKQMLAAWEAAGQAVVDKGNWRIQTAAALQQLICCGNVLEFMDSDNNLKLFRLDQYVVARDWLGNLLEFIVEEKMARLALPDEARGMVPGKDPQEEVTIYTWCRRSSNGDFYEIMQEVDDQIVPNTVGNIDADKLPYNALRWATTPGEIYGRSKVEEHGGDLRSLEGLEKALLEGAAMASRNIIMIKPTATAGGMRRRVAEAKNGDVLTGDFEQIAMMSFENKIGMQLTAEYAERVERRLRFAFLLNQAVQRNAERVTATEITVLVEEIENALGGVYSMLSHEMMEWRLGRLLFNLQRKGVIPVWPDGDITPRVLTGLEALSRDRDVSRVTTAAELIKMFGEPAMEVIEITDLLRQAFIGLGLQDVTLSRDEIEKRQEMKARLEAMVKAIPQAIAGQQQQ